MFRSVAQFICLVSFWGFFYSTLVMASEPWSLDALLSVALQHNAKIQTASAMAKVYKARVSPTGTWEDPRLGIELMNVPIEDPALDRTPMSGIQYSVKQTIPFPGKKSKARDEQRWFSKAAIDDANTVVLQVLWQLRHVYYSLVETKKTLMVLTRNQDIADQLVQVAQKRFAANLTPQQDVLKAQVEYGRLRESLLAVEQRERALYAQIRFLVGKDIEGSIQIPDKLEFHRVKESATVLREAMFKNQPTILATRKRVKAAESKITLAQRQYFPDIDLTFAYRQRVFSTLDPIQGEDFFSVGISVPLPIFAHAKQRQGVVEAKAEYQQRQAIASDTEKELIAKFEETLSKLSELEARYDLIRQALLPQAKAAFENSKVAYQAGKIEFISVLTNQLALLQFEIDLVKTTTGYFQEIAKLNYLQGNEPHLNGVNHG